VINSLDEAPPTRQESVDKLIELGLTVPDNDDLLMRRYLWATSIHIEDSQGADLAEKI
jgi:hypothetical protein